MTRTDRTPFSCKRERGFFICRSVDSAGFMPTHLKRHVQGGFFEEQFYMSSCYYHANGFPLASFTDQRVGV